MTVRNYATIKQIQDFLQGEGINISIPPTKKSRNGKGERDWLKDQLKDTKWPFDSAVEEIVKRARDKEAAVVVSGDVSNSPKRKRTGKVTPTSEVTSMIEERGCKIDDLVFLRQIDNRQSYLIGLALNKGIDHESDQNKVLPLKWLDSRVQETDEIVLWSSEDLITVTLDTSIANLILDSEDLVIIEGYSSIYSLNRNDQVTFIERSMKVFDNNQLDMKSYFECVLANHNGKVVCTEDDLRKYFNTTRLRHFPPIGRGGILIYRKLYLGKKGLKIFKTDTGVRPSNEDPTIVHSCRNKLRDMGLSLLYEFHDSDPHMLSFMTWLVSYHRLCFMTATYPNRQKMFPNVRSGMHSRDIIKLEEVRKFAWSLLKAIKASERDRVRKVE